MRMALIDARTWLSGAWRMQVCAAAWLVCTVFPAPGLAQMPATPSAAQMVEQLKAPPRTRSLAGALGEAGATRNLTVEARQPDQVSQESVASPPTPAPARPSLSLQIQFDFNSAKVRAESQQALSNLAQALRSPELLSAAFAIEGHTDAKGRADYNHKLSQLRAEAVREYLAQQGIEAARLHASGKGSSDLANGADPYAAENRRVRIVNLN